MKTHRLHLLQFLAGALLLSACGVPLAVSSTPSSVVQAPTATVQSTATVQPTPTQAFNSGAFYSGLYRNLFKEYLSKSDTEIQKKIDSAFNQLFYGSDDSERIYYPVDPDMAYIEDIGNQDVRSEGMSYGMMIAVQLDKQEEFNRLWKWAKTYMFHADGPYRGYFSWHNQTSGEKIDNNPASDGEEWFAMALLFADARWGSQEGLFDYRTEAQAILNTALHKDEENSPLATNMFDPETKQVVFVPKLGRDSNFTDPSYHLPHYYELWEQCASQDNAFWKEAAAASRQHLKAAANPQTGLMPDYANFDGTPYGTDDHKDFRFDAWRTLANVAMDYAWFGGGEGDPQQAEWEVTQSNRVLEFLKSQGMDSYPNQYDLNGKPLSGDRSTGLVSTAAAAALAADPETGKPFVQALWDTQTPTGKWRYYDGMLNILALLQVSGNFRIYSCK